MKSSEEMIKSLFERREQYIKDKKMKRKRLIIVASSLAVCFVVIVVALGIPAVIGDEEITLSVDAVKTTSVNEKENSTSDIESEGSSTTEKEKESSVNNNEKTTFSEKKGQIEITAGEIKISLFEATPKASDEDSFGEDELRHIDVTLDGYKFYTQLKKSDYSKYGIKPYLKKSDFGKKLGVITEIDGDSKDLKTPCSQEPTLAGCEVYLYKPVDSEAVIIVKGNGHCSLFYFLTFAEEGHSYNENYEIFNVSSAGDIERIDYSVKKPDGAIIVTTEKGSITDKNDIKKFVNITKGLRPYIRESAVSGDPEWLNDAREEYKKNKENIVYIDASIVLKNGLSIPFDYEPNLGTGYVPEHFFLSEADNAVMSKLFKR